MKDFVETNVEKKIENSIIEGNGFLTLIIPVKLGKIKEIKFEIKEKDLTEKEVQNNIMEFVNKIYWENEELKKKINELQIENKKISNKLEETKKDLEQSGVKKMERINNLFKDSAIIKNDEKKMKNDWIDPYGEKKILLVNCYLELVLMEIVHLLSIKNVMEKELILHLLKQQMEKE